MMMLCALLLLMLAMTSAIPAPKYRYLTETRCTCPNTIATCHGYVYNLFFRPPFPSDSAMAIPTKSVLTDFKKLTNCNLKCTPELTERIGSVYIRCIPGDDSYNPKFNHQSGSINSFLTKHDQAKRSVGVLSDEINQTCPCLSQSLNVSGSNLKIYNTTFFQTFSNFPFKEHHFRNNSIQTVYLSYDNAIEVLDLGYNQLREMPDFCRQKTVLMPNLRSLWLDGNPINSINIRSIGCLTKLTELALPIGNFTSVEAEMFNTFQSLENLHLIGDQERPHELLLDDDAFKSSTLRFLDLDGIFISTLKGNNYSDIFRGVPGLCHLNLQYGKSNRYFEDQLFDSLPIVLTHLSLSYSTGVDHIPARAFVKLEKLEKLEMNSCSIKTLQSHAFDGLVSLKILSMRDNKLQTIRSDAFPPIVLSMLRFLDLSNNILVCDCYLKWFVNWARHPKKLGQRTYGTCSIGDTPSKVDLTGIDADEFCPDFSFTEEIGGVAGVIGFTIGIIFACVLERCKCKRQNGYTEMAGANIAGSGQSQ